MSTARFASLRPTFVVHALATTALLLTSAASSPAWAAIVYFPVNSGGSISQPGSGGQPTGVAFGDINLSTGTFNVAGDFADPTSSESA